MKAWDKDIESAKARLLEVVKQYVQLEARGKEYCGLCPFHEEKNPSFSVVPEKGFFKCFGCDAGGDAIDFVRRLEGLSFQEAVRKILGSLGSGEGAGQGKLAKFRPLESQIPSDEWEAVIPVPNDAPPPPDDWWTKRKGNWLKLKTTCRWAYLDSAGRLIGYVSRSELPNGGKEIVPLVYCRSRLTGEEEWRRKSFAKPRPIFGLEELAQRPDAPVLVVEGEKTCVAARKRKELQSMVIVSWPGGAKAVQHVDWSPLYGRRVGLWPDADLKHFVSGHPRAGELMPFEEQPGTSAMLNIFELIKDKVVGIKLIRPPDGMPDGWDLADAPPESDWNAYVHIQRNRLDPNNLRGHRINPSLSCVQAATKEVNTDERFNLKRNTDPFTVLGHNRGTYFYLPKATGQIIPLTANQHTKNALLQLAPLAWWEERFDTRFTTPATDYLIQSAHKRGLLDTRKIRGRGCWFDNDRVILNVGDRLIVDGRVEDHSEVDTKYVYPADVALNIDLENPLSAHEAQRLVTGLCALNWKDPGDAKLFAGALVVAPICGALRFRPHIWVSGGSGCGKSYIADRVARPCLGQFAASMQGTTTEAGIRQTLERDALPVLFDEAEAEDKADHIRIKAILNLIRQSSSESLGRIVKGTPSGQSIEYLIRSTFMLFSINTKAVSQADLNRIAIVELLPYTSSVDFSFISDVWGSRLRARTISLLPIILKSISIIQPIAAKRLGSSRLGDRNAPLIAGFWSLGSDSVITEEEATALVEEGQVRDSTELAAESDERQLFRLLKQSRIEIEVHALNGSVQRLQRSVGELIDVIANGQAEEVTSEVAHKALLRHGFKCEGNTVAVSNTHIEIAWRLRDSRWPHGWGSALKRLPGARSSVKSIQFAGTSTVAVWVPIDADMPPNGQAEASVSF